MKYLLLIFLTFNLYAQGDEEPPPVDNGGVIFLKEEKCFVLNLNGNLRTECRTFTDGSELVEVAKEDADIEILTVDMEFRTAVVDPVKKQAKILAEENSKLVREAEKQDAAERLLKEREFKLSMESKLKVYETLTPEQKDELTKELIKTVLVKDLPKGDLENARN